MMLISSYFEPTIDNAPCPPFFVDNVYDIFINATQENNLNSTVTVAIWDKCVQQFPQLSTTTSTTPTTTTTTTTEQTTTSTKPTTTTTTEQTTPTTTITTKQTTPTTSTTTKQTTPTTTATTEKTTTSTTPTTTTTTKQTTTSKTPTTTADTHTTSTGKITSKPVTTFSTTKASSETSTAITFSVTNVTTVTPSQQASLKQCDGFCLLGVIMFSVCIFVGVLVTVIAVKCYSSKRKKNVNINDNIRKNRNGKVKSVNYRQKFPKMSRQADFNSNPLAFENPTFIGHNGFIPGFYNTNTDQYNHRAHASEITHNYKRFPDVERNIYQVHVYPGQSLNPVDAWMSSSSNNAGFMNSYKRPYKKRHRHSSIGSHVPKILLNNENDYSFGVVSYDDNFGLPKLDIGHYDSDIDIPDYPGLPRIPLEENINNTETGFNDSDIDIPDYPGLPRIPLEENINNTETGFNIEQRQTVEKQSKNETDVKVAVRHGFPRIPIESIGNGGGVKVKTERKGLPRTEIKETENNEGFDSYKKLLHRTPF